MANSITQPRLLITGGAGYLGRRLVWQASGWDVHATWHRTPLDALPTVTGYQLDLRDATATHDLIATIQPQVIIHTAPSSGGPEHIAAIVPAAHHISRAAAGSGARLIHLSTDALLDGEHAPYSDDAPPQPLHAYGRAKAEAEQIIGEGAAGTVIVRTSLIYGRHPDDPHTRWLAESLRKGERITLFTDEFRCPVWVDNLAEALLELARSDFSGYLNLAGPQPLSRWDFGLKLLGMLGLEPGETILPGRASESGLVRPRDLRLDGSLAQRVLQTRLLGVDQAIARICAGE